MDPRCRVDSGDAELEETEGGVQGVLGDIGPDGKGRGETTIENDPIDNGDQKRVGGHAGPEEVMEGLEGSREASEGGGVAILRVGEGVNCGHGEVAGGAPVAEN